MQRCDICGEKIADGKSNIFMQYGITPKVVCEHCYSLLSRDGKNIKYAKYLKSHIKIETLLPAVLIITSVLLSLLTFFSLFFVQTNSLLSRAERIIVIITISLTVLFLAWSWIVFFLSRKFLSKN